MFQQQNDHENNIHIYERIFFEHLFLEFYAIQRKCLF